MGLINDLPDGLKTLWFDTPLWKILAVVSLSIVAAIIMTLLHRWINTKALEGQILPRFRRLLTPLVSIAVVLMLQQFFDSQVNTSGEFATTVDSFVILVNYLAVVWIFWLTVVILLEWIILSRTSPIRAWMPIFYSWPLR